jgi:phage shock protein A
MTLEELSRLDYPGAMELILAYSTDIKRHDIDIQNLRKEAEVWGSRVRLAEAKGLADLAQEAKKQAADIEEHIASIEASRAELSTDVARLKEALPGMKARERSIDPDRLQAELSMMTGEALDPAKAELDKQLGALEKDSGDSALQALKRKMGL